MDYVVYDQLNKLTLHFGLNQDQDYCKTYTYLHMSSKNKIYMTTYITLYNIKFDIASDPESSFFTEPCLTSELDSSYLAGL